MNVTSNIIDKSYKDGKTDNIIYSFFPNVSPGYKIVETPHNLIYLPINMKTIPHLETKLVDQNGELVNMRGETLSIKYLKYVKCEIGFYLNIKWEVNTLI